MTGAEIIHLLADVVSKNGNLLLNVGPTSSGEIPWSQAMRLLELGAWLRINGDAIYRTRPWHTAAATTPDGIDVRFTRTRGALYAIVLGTPAGAGVAIPGVRPVVGTQVELLGYRAPLTWRRQRDGIAIDLPRPLSASPAFALRIAPAPQ